MSRYSTASKTSTTLGVAVGSVIAIPVDDWFTGKGVNPTFSLFCAVILIALGAWSVSFVMDTIFGSSVLVRQLLLGPQFIDGTWVDIVYDENGVVSSIGQTCIEAEGYSIAFHGQNFSVSGDYRDGFHSQMVDLAWPRLRLVGVNSEQIGADAAPRSYCEIQFTSAGGAPTRYTGTFRIIGTGGSFRLQGRKVTSRKDLKALGDDAEQQAALLRLAAPMIQRVRQQP